MIDLSIDPIHAVNELIMDLQVTSEELEHLDNDFKRSRARFQQNCDLKHFS